MPVEIERKFLVIGEGWKRVASESSHMRQGYLGGERCSVRVRLEEGHANLNIKALVVGTSRAEFEYAIPREEAAELLYSLCTGRVIEKTRYRVDHAGRTWEVDVFHGDNEGLVIAEVELDDPDEPVELPDWVGPEVTAEERYYNVFLSRNPYREWRSDG